MGTRGPESAAALSVASINHKARLAPPAGLSELELEVWRLTISSKPADWFEKSHIPLLCQYVRHVSYVQVIKAQIDAMESNWLTDEAGLKRYDRLLTMHEREGRAISSLATRLRLTPQSVYSARKGAGYTPGTGRRPWEPEGLESN
jgi:hypothetical protein